MSLQDQISADQAAVSAAQASLDAANTALAADQAKLASIQPHLSIVARIRAELVQLNDAVDQGMLAIEARISPILDELEAAISAG